VKPAQKTQKISDVMMRCRIFCRIFCMMLCTFYSMTDTVWASVLRIDRQTGRTGEKISFAVSAADVPNAVNALGFEVNYDASVLRFRGFAPGSLTQNFTNFSAGNTDFGTVRIGGFDAGENQISQGASGVLVSLEFEVVSEKNCEVQIQNLLDDVKDWSVTQGSFSGNSAEENEESEESKADEDQKADAGTEEQPESGQSSANADSDLSAYISLNPLENTSSSLNNSPASSPDMPEISGTGKNPILNPHDHTSAKSMPEISRRGNNGKKATETQAENLLSQGEDMQNLPDEQGKIPDSVQESKKTLPSGTFDLQTAPHRNWEGQSRSVNAEKENCATGIWHWMMFAVLLLILGMQILILRQIMKSPEGREIS